MLRLFNYLFFSRFQWFSVDFHSIFSRSISVPESIFTLWICRTLEDWLYLMKFRLDLSCQPSYFSEFYVFQIFAVLGLLLRICGVVKLYFSKMYAQYVNIYNNNSSKYNWIVKKRSLSSIWLCGIAHTQRKRLSKGKMRIVCAYYG